MDSTPSSRDIKQMYVTARLLKPWWYIQMKEDISLVGNRRKQLEKVQELEKKNNGNCKYLKIKKNLYITSSNITPLKVVGVRGIYSAQMAQFMSFECYLIMMVYISFVQFSELCEGKIRPGFLYSQALSPFVEDSVGMIACQKQRPESSRHSSLHEVNRHNFFSPAWLRRLIKRSLPGEDVACSLDGSVARWYCTHCSNHRSNHYGFGNVMQNRSYDSSLEIIPESASSSYLGTCGFLP